ncbi:hypothetical protein ASPZODRAFT_132627 [Penicilliopsis zonata CBS 506.65]|uniref:Protein YOP1 n=1 Tax=Penicilliopsis zonata CBS 506.65 TaxID=1073090 RepID=A0A1L9SHB5_9EURO|nr:hypothetical protein ASPZODRAFT_132627 [Penicilliopsis zonata CBS 506.65]OJJ46558.1 hypothetical protein ASPZODRAFT_132627 [Penicilliopsis zonata CBS 506.65]
MSSVVTILFPVFASYKALRSSDPGQLAPWLMYWVVLSVILLAESWTVFIIGWFPFYSWLRLFFLSYLVLPQTQGARLLYEQYVDPFLAHHEREIEVFIGRTHEQAKALGLQYFYQAIDFIREKVLGLPPQRPAPPPPPAATGPAAYAQSLLSRFNIPAASGGAAAQGSSTDWMSPLAAILQSVVSSDKSREAHMEQLSASGGFLPREMASMSRKDRAQYIVSQRELLDMLRSALVREEKGLDGDKDEGDDAETETDDLAYGMPLRKNRSDNSFDHIEADDLGGGSRERSSPEDSRPSSSSGGWASTWFGQSSGAEHVQGESRARHHY